MLKRFWIPDQKSKHVCLPDPSSSYPTLMLFCATFAQREGLSVPGSQREGLLTGMHKYICPFPRQWEKEQVRGPAHLTWLAFQCETQIKKRGHRSSQQAPDWLSPEAMWLRWQDKEGHEAVLLPGGTRAGALETAANYQPGVARRAACRPQHRNKPLPVSPLPCFGERLAEAAQPICCKSQGEAFCRNSSEHHTPPPPWRVLVSVSRSVPAAHLSVKISALLSGCGGTWQPLPLPLPS